jgi:hypothetical protein
MLSRHLGQVYKGIPDVDVPLCFTVDGRLWMLLVDVDHATCECIVL